MTLNIFLKVPSRISLNAHGNRGGRSVTSVSHSTFGGTKLIEAHVPTQGAGCTGARGHRWERNPGERRPHSAPDSLKFPAGSAGWRHKPRPFRNPHPFCCRAPTRREPGSPREPIRKGLRQVPPFSEPIGGRPERGLPGHVGTTSCLGATCQRGKRPGFR